MNALDWLIAAGAGGLASFARFMIDGVVSLRTERSFPYGTFVVNVSGAILLGLLTGLALDPTDETLLGVATIGSYTTFSTWMLETHRLSQEGDVSAAYLNALANLLVGLAAIAVGRSIGHHL
ncbi:MAG: fluoride efflux transporter CrcB [Thermoleophilia bacterium]